MKTKIILVIAISAIATLSFSFATVNKADKNLTEQPNLEAKHTEPIGGFVSEDKF